MFEDFLYTGTGCPLGSIEHSDSTSGADGATRYTLAFAFREYALSTVSGGAAEQERRCRITVTVRGQAGVQFALDSAIFTGSLQLDEGTDAVMVSS